MLPWDAWMPRTPRQLLWCVGWTSSRVSSADPCPAISSTAVLACPSRAKPECVPCRYRPGKPRAPPSGTATGAPTLLSDLNPGLIKPVSHPALPSLPFSQQQLQLDLSSGFPVTHLPASGIIATCCRKCTSLKDLLV